MYSAVVIDDEEDAIQLLTQLLSNFTSIKIKVIGTANKLNEGFHLIKKTNPDIVFLDIDMPDENGLGIYNYFKDPAFKIIFVTAYQQFAVDALNKAAFGYLLKPVNIINLQEMLQRVSKQLKFDQRQLEIEDMLNTFSTTDIAGKNIILDVENGFLVENTRNIEYCYASQAYSVVSMHTKKEITVSKSLKALQELLPEYQFYRTHKSYLVNIYYIRKFVKGSESYVILKSGTKIPVSVRVSSIISNDIKKILLA